MGKRKRKEDRILTILVSTLELVEGMRLPIAPPTRKFKDKNRYNRKSKHKKGYRDGSLF